MRSEERERLGAGQAKDNGIITGSYRSAATHPVHETGVVYLLVGRGIAVTMLRRGRSAGGHRSGDRAATWTEFFLPRGFRTTLIHFCLALVKGFEFLDRN